MVTMVRAAVTTGEYASSSEVVREALRDWSHRRDAQRNGIEELRSLWQQARNSKEPKVPAHDVLDRLERKYQTLANAADAGR